jgi:hypothetical protein
MSAELERIETALAQINATLQRQSKDILELREQTQNIAQANNSIPVSVVIYPECGYEWMWVRIHLDANTWSRIKSGEHLTIKGKGWIPDEKETPNPKLENFYWDYWEFNGGIDKPMKVTMESPHDDFLDPEDLIAYEGKLLQEFIREFNKD